MNTLRLGTSSWTGEGWEKTFYPAGTSQRDYLPYYATKFDTVEVDSTFYRTPSASMVKRWRDVTPDGFLMSAKLPKEITHDKMLVDCREELKKFVGVMELLGDRLGPLVIQMQYLNKKTMPSLDAFLERLVPFVESLPKGPMWALEVRNKTWYQPKLLDFLRKHQVSLVLIDHPWMPRPTEFRDPDALLTGPFAYIRWLGDRYKIEETTKTWEKIVVDRSREMKEWVPLVERYLQTAKWVFAYANNHYAGFAPGSVELFLELWKDANRK
jgi:uncharacterized protein YecE (DUF72 family)